MDPITHGITGALLGKGLFSGRQGRVATFAATLGAVFPDVDIVAEAISRDPLAIVKYHRGITHSFVALPFFAALLAWLTRVVIRRRGIEAPSWAMLTLIYGVGIASHILLDGTTSFGTRMWTPISQKRVAWDLMFIIDFVLSSCVLLPQVVAWIYSEARAGLGAATSEADVGALQCGRAGSLGRRLFAEAIRFTFGSLGWPARCWPLCFFCREWTGGTSSVKRSGLVPSGIAWSRLAIRSLRVRASCGDATGARILPKENQIAVVRMGALPSAAVFA